MISALLNQTSRQTIGLVIYTSPAILSVGVISLKARNTSYNARVL